jgi:hypothetical protein
MILNYAVLLLYCILAFLNSQEQLIITILTIVIVDLTIVVVFHAQISAEKCESTNCLLKCSRFNKGC